MAHKISNIDKQQGTRQAWHKLTEILPQINLSDCWLSKWDLVKSPLFSANQKQTDYCELICSDNPEIRVGKPIHCETYGFISNREFLEIIGESISSITGATVESVGSVCERGRIFVSVAIPEAKEFKAAGRSFLPYLNFFSSHDLSAPFGAQASTVCIVCDNTFRMNLHQEKGGELQVRIPHTRNASKRLENIPQLVDAYCGTQAKFKAILDGMESAPVAQNDANAFFAGLLTVKTNSEANAFLRKSADDIPEMSTRKTNQINRLSDLFVSGAGNTGSNRADVFSAVTDYYSHESSGGEDSMRQLASSEFGSGQTTKARAFDLLQNDTDFALFSKVGAMALS